MLTGDRPKRQGDATWALEWCWPCKRDNPDEPVHEETECPHYIRCDECGRVCPKGAEKCLNCGMCPVCSYDPSGFWGCACTAAKHLGVFDV